jgi:hypothetical protein
MSTTLDPAAARPGIVRRARRVVRTHPFVTAGGTLVIGALVVWLVFFVFAFHLLFIDDTVNEADPFASASPSLTAPGTSPAIANGAARETHRGSFVDRGHPASGEATITTDGSKTFLRFEELRTDNGPDLFVYLSAGVTATSPSGELDDDFVDLGKLKGNIGSQNYEVPSGTDLAKYKTVVIWCRRFATAFGASDLTATLVRG